MIKVIIFGGTAEGRRLCEYCESNNIPVLYCVTTEDGARPVKTMRNIKPQIGRLNMDEMWELFKQNAPALVVDATHPYAQEARRSIANACKRTGIRLVRVIRDSGTKEYILSEDEQSCPTIGRRDCLLFGHMEDLVYWLEKEPGNIFVTTGSTAAEAFTRLPDFQRRVWIRIIPNLKSLNKCLDLKYPPEHLICMQGPFSEELNRAMFKSANARILVTKDSGAAGGFNEKFHAARSLFMVTAVLSKPEESSETKLEDACGILSELMI